MIRATLSCLLAASLLACGARPDPAVGAAPATELIVLQLNDVYEMNPVGGAGGLARVATLRARLAQEAPVLTVLAGDFLSPSAIGLAEVKGERLAGAQMVGTFNAMGLDLATFGNHEFDVKEHQLLARLTESKFAWISGNVSRRDGAQFPGVARWMVRTMGGLKVGIFAVTLGSNPKDWVRYADPHATARKDVAAIQAQGADVIIGLTHLDLEDDMKIAASIPAVDMVLGGHEHENWRVERGADFTPVLKADANARTVFVHRVRRVDGVVKVDSELVYVDAKIPDEPGTAAEAKRWTDLAFDSFRAQGLEPERVVTTAWEDLDGREASVRNGSTAMTRLLAEAVHVEGAQASLYNSGSIRIDDVIPSGATVTEYDVLRILPFGGEVVSARLTGATLVRVLEAGQKNKGKGGWLQTDGIGGDPGAWTIGGAAIDPAASYTIAVNDFLLSGREDNLDFFTADAVTDQKEHGDIRKLFIARLSKGDG